MHPRTLTGERPRFKADCGLVLTQPGQIERQMCSVGRAVSSRDAARKVRAIVLRTALRDSNVVVQMKLVRVRAQADLVDLLLVFVLDVHVEHVAGEDVALQEKLVILVELGKRFFE